MADDLPTFPFVVGCGRSGTELLRAMLTSHPDLAIPVESQFIVRAARRFDRQPFRTDEFLDWVAGQYRTKAHWNLDVERLREQARVDPPADYATAVRALFAQLAAQDGKSRYGDKTPSYASQLTTLATTFPEARFVHLVRDGRDVAGSLRKAGFGPNHLGACALYWQREIETCRRQGQMLGDRYMELTYEDLVDQPEKELRLVCAHIDLSYSPRMLKYHEDDELLSNLLAPGHHQRLSEPPTVGSDWRRDGSARDIALLEALVGSTLDDFGYARARGSPPLWARAWADGYRLAVAVKSA